VSRLITRLREARQGTGGGLGFVAGPFRRPAPMVLVALSQSPEQGPLALSAGADAFLLRSSGPEALQRAEALLKGQVWGAWLEDPPPPPCDFLVVGGSAPARLLAQGEWGRLLALEAPPSPEEERGLSALPVDAFLWVPPLALPLTVGALAGVAGLGARLRRPLLAVVTGPPDPEDLACLRDAGLAGLCLDLDTAPREALAGLRSALERLAPRPGARPVPAVGPSLLAHPASAPEEGDGEEDRTRLTGLGHSNTTPGG